MSEKPTVAKHIIAKSVEEAEEFVRRSTEYCSEKKRMSEKKPTKDTNCKKAEKVTDAHETTETSPSIATTSEMSISKKSENSEPATKCEMSKTTSEISTSVKFETLEIPEVYENIESTSETSTESKVPEPKGSEVCQIAEDVSKISASGKSDNAKFPEKCQVSRTTSEDATPAEPFPKKVPEESENSEIREITTDMSKIFASAKSEDDKLPEALGISGTTSEEFILTESDYPEHPKAAHRMIKEMSTIYVRNPEMYAFAENLGMRVFDESISTVSGRLSKVFVSAKSANCNNNKLLEMLETSGESTLNESSAPEKSEERQMTKDMSKMSTSDESEDVSSSQISTPFEFDELENSIADQTHSSTFEISTSFQFEDEVNSAKRFTDNNSKISTKKCEESPVEKTKSLANNATKKIIFTEKERPLVLATHRLVPSLPIELFEVLAEIIEAVAGRPVVLTHEWRDLPPTEMVDIVVTQPDENWEHGVLLPASFVFEHHLNKDTLQPGIYVDVVVPRDRDSHIKDIMNLRGYKCAFPTKQSSLTAVGVLLRYLQLKGESIYYFGNISDAKTQLEALEMVINQEAQVAVLEAPVIKCHKSRLRNMDSVDILASLGPLPPYRIMVKKTLADESNLIEDLTTYLIDIHENENWMERLMSFGIIGFCLNSQNIYDEARKKYPVLSNTYYY